MAGMALTLRREDWWAMREHVAREAPYEACGMVAGREGQSAHVFPIPNELRSPTRYRMEPRAQLAAFEAMDEHGWELLAIYHSHPQGRAYPATGWKADVSARCRSGCDEHTGANDAPAARPCVSFLHPRYRD